MKPIWVALICSIAAFCAAAVAEAASKSPYDRVPAAGQFVRLDGTLGGAKSAWAYYDQQWLEQYLKVTVDSAAANRPYSDETDRLNVIAAHVTTVPNGTRALIETVQEFSYGGRVDVEVRVSIQDGPQRGRELWTTCAELVDSAGHPFVHM